MDAGDLPNSYNETGIVLLPIDPYLIHAYWDVTPSKLDEVKKSLGSDYQRAQPTLRFYDLADINTFDSTHAHSSFDVDVQLEARNWYVHLWSPEGSYDADLGLRTEDGRFVALARSNVVQTPRAWPPVAVEEHYMLVEGDYQHLEIVPPPANLGAVLPREESIPIHEAPHGIERIESEEAEVTAKIESAEPLRQSESADEQHAIADYQPVEIIPSLAQFNIAPLRQEPAPAEAHEARRGIDWIESGDVKVTAKIESAELMRQSEGTQLVLSVHARAEEGYFDLTAMSEKRFISGTSSRFIEQAERKSDTGE